jgi:hypothetical protein
MSACQCKSGFFALRDCGEVGVGNCSQCQRAMCARHSAPDSGFTLCLDCQARSGQGRTSTERDDGYDDQWAHGYRHRYYSAGYTPIYTGHRSHGYYDQYDTRSFDQRHANAGELGDDDSTSAGFGDS